MPRPEQAYDLHEPLIQPSSYKAIIQTRAQGHEVMIFPASPRHGKGRVSLRKAAGSPIVRHGFEAPSAGRLLRVAAGAFVNLPLDHQDDAARAH